MNTSTTAIAPAAPGLLARVFRRRFALNYASTLVFIGVSYWIISSLSSFHQSILQGQWDLGMFGIGAVISVRAVFIALIASYAVILIPYYAAYPWMHSSSFTFARGLWFALRRGSTRITRKTRAPMSLPLDVRISTVAWLAGIEIL